MNVRLIINLFVLAAVIGSALGVVHHRHESRRYSVELAQLEDRRDEYIAEWSRLQIEQAWLADAGHVENEARERLRMRDPDDRVILVVEP